MKRNGSRIIALLLTMLLLTTVGGVASADAAEAELYTVQVFNANAVKLSKWSDTPVGKAVLDKFNFDVELIPNPAGDAKEQLGLMLAAGNYPEIVTLQDQDITNKYIDATALVALDPYLDQMPNFTEWYKESIPYWRWAAGDGNLYNWNIQIPQDQAVFPENNDILVRSDLLEQQDWAMPVSTEEWVAFLKEAKAQNPTTPDGETTIGMAAPFGESWGMALAPILYEKGYGIQVNDASIFYDANADAFVDMFTHPDTKESFAFFNKLYQEGLLDEECFTDKGDQVLAKMSSGRALSVWYITWYMNSANNALKDRGFETMMYINTPVMGVGQIERGEKNIIMTQLTRPFYTVAVTQNAKNPERILQVVDFFSSEEGQVLLQSGVEGVHYTIEDGKRIATEAYIEGALNVEDYQLFEGIGAVPTFGVAASTSPVDQQPYALSQTETVVSKTRPERVNTAYAALNWATPLDWWLENAAWQTVGAASGIALDQQSDDGVLEAKLADFRIKNTGKLIMAGSDEEFESMYDELVNQYNEMNPQSIVDKYNALYQTANDDIAKYK